MKKQIFQIVGTFKTEGLLLVSDEVGSQDWQAAKSGVSKVELIRARVNAVGQIVEAEGEGK